MNAKSAKAIGFTLVELLVVIAIIAILTSLLLPALSKAKESVRAVQCAGNMRNLSLAFNCYLNDYDSFYPNWQWQTALTSFIPNAEGKNVLPVGLCPSAPLTAPANSAYPGAQLLSHYVYNGVYYDSQEFFSCYGKNYCVSQSAVKSPSTKVMLLEAWFPPNSGGVVWGSNRIYVFSTIVHSNGGNFLFSDGHVERIFIPGGTAFGEIVDPVAQGALTNSQLRPKT